MSGRTLRFTILTVLLSATFSLQARAADEVVFDDSVLQALEVKADAASPRDRVFLYTELLRKLTESEGAVVSAGDTERANTILTHMEKVASKLKAAESKDARRLKNAEELMERTTERLHDMMHLTTDDQRTAMKATLDHLNHLHDEMLALVFAQ